MADEPKLVVALEARLDKFEKQLKEAGVIAEREVKNIEDKFSQANPQFAGTFLGSFLGTAAAQGMKAIIGFIEDAIKRFTDLGKVSKLVNIEMNELFGIQQAAAKFGAPIDDVTKSVRNLAELLDRMKRGEDNSLSKLLDINPQLLRGATRESLTILDAWRIIGDAIQNADSTLQKNTIAQMVGASESLVKFLEKGGDHMQRLQKAAADAAPDLNKLVNQAEEFDKAWNKAIENTKSALFQLGGAALDHLRTALGVGRQLVGAADEAGFIEFARSIRTQRTSGDVAGGGTATRDPNRPITRLPSLAREGGEGRDRFDAAADRIEKRTAAIVAETAAIDKGTEAREKAKIAAELETVAKQVNGTVTEEQRKRIEELATAYGKAAAAIEQARSPLQTFGREAANVSKMMNQFAATSLETVTSELANVVTGTKTAAEAFQAMAKSIINDLAKIAIRAAITGPIARALGASLGTGAASPFPIFAPGNAAGTDNWRGGATWVGERGPELINLPRGSQVIPNDIARQTAGGGITVAPVFNVDASGADPAAIIRLEQALRATSSTVEARALRAVQQHGMRYA